MCRSLSLNVSVWQMQRMWLENACIGKTTFDLLKNAGDVCNKQIPTSYIAQRTGPSILSYKNEQLCVSDSRNTLRALRSLNHTLSLPVWSWVESRVEFLPELVFCLFFTESFFFVSCTDHLFISVLLVAQGSRFLVFPVKEVSFLFY